MKLAAAKRGRPAAASPDDVLALARAKYLAGGRIDLTLLASELGLGRATIYRWFGSREAVLGEVIARELEAPLAVSRRRVRRRGAVGLLAVFDHVNRRLATATALHRLLEEDPSLEMVRGRLRRPRPPRSSVRASILLESF